MRIRLLIIILLNFSPQLCCLTWGEVFAQQTKKDSLITIIQIAREDTIKINTLNILGKELIDKGDLELGLRYIKDAKTLAEKLNYKNGFADALSNEGFYLNKKKQYKKALVLHNEALKIWTTLNDEVGIRYSNYNIGSTYQWLNLYKEASEYFYKSMELAEAARDSFLLYKSLSSTAYLFQFLGNLNESISYQKKAIEYIKSSHRDDYCIGIIFLADYYALNNEPDKADSVLKIGYSITQELKSPYHQSYYYNIKSEIEAQRRNYGQAILSLLNSNKFEASLSATANLPYNYANIANYILKSDKAQLAIAGIHYDKKYDEGIRYAQKSLDITIPAGIINLTSDNYYLIYSAYKNKGNFEKSLQYFEMFKGIKDSLFNVKNTETIHGLKLKYETEKKEQQIKLLSKENETKSLATEKEKQTKNFAFSGIAVLILLGGYIFILYSKRKKLSNQLSQSLTDLKQTQEQLIKIEKEKEAEKIRVNLARDLHDDLGASLSSISVYSVAAQQRLNSNNIKEVSNMLERISNDAQEMAAAVSERVWLMKTENNSIEKLIEHLQLFASGVLTARNISFAFNCNDDLKNVVLNIETRKNIYLIFKEAINNAAKYSRATTIKLHATSANNNLQIILSDDGSGFDAMTENHHQTGGGNGLSNMRQRADEINAQIEIASSVEKGTSLKISYTLPKIGEH